MGGHVYRIYGPCASYILAQLEKNGISRQALRQAHYKAAHYYLQQARSKGQLLAQKRPLRQINFLLEAVWHLSKAERWQEAYILMENEGIFGYLKETKEYDVLLEYCQLFLQTRLLNKSQTAALYSWLEDTYKELENI